MKFGFEAFCILYGLLFWVWIISKYTKQKQWKTSVYKKKIIIHLIFNLGLAPTSFWTIWPCLQVNLTEAHDPINKAALGQQDTSKKHVTSMSSKLEPAIWSCDTGQPILCFDQCQLTVTWMASIKGGCYKARMYVSVNLLPGVLLASCETPSLCAHVHKQYH